MYGRENRLKVARDEAKHEEEQRVKAEKQRLVRAAYPLCTSATSPRPSQSPSCFGLLHPDCALHHTLLVQGESEARRAFLLRQAAIKRGDDPGEAQAQLPEQPASQGSDAPPTGLLQHVNFFVEHEARELHPEVPLAAPSDCLQCALW